LYRWHIWHHRVFDRDLNIVSDDIYRQAQWRHDLPECGVMLVASGLWVWSAWLWQPQQVGLASLGILYTLSFLASAIARGTGWKWAYEKTDLTHLPGPFAAPPSHWLVNRSYHWRHHFDNQKAYYCGTLTLVDRLMGTALSLKGKTVAVTGASGSLGQALLRHLHRYGATPIALTTRPTPISISLEGESLVCKTVTWQVGSENALADLFQTVDILILNHGLNVHGERTSSAIAQSYEVNAFSSWRLLELFLSTVTTNTDIARKEVWVNTSEAEVSPAFSPLYELSKRTLGDLVTLRRLDAPCVIRKVILGPFKSNLNPIGILSVEWVAQQVLAQAKRDVRNIIVAINPLTFIAFPIKEWAVSTYFRLFSRSKS
jgi:hypothetical protein